MMNKRNFMLGTAGAVAALPALSIPPASATSPGLRALLGLPAIAVNAGARDWAAYLQQTFELQGEQGRQVVRLNSVARVTVDQVAQSLEQFVLGFVSADGAPLTAGLHTLRHANGQGATLHLSASGSSAQTALRAEFSLLRSA